jgi:hypothetical protein
VKLLSSWAHRVRLGGRERTLQEYVELLERAGFHFLRAVPGARFALPHRQAGTAGSQKGCEAVGFVSSKRQPAVGPIAPSELE